MYAIIRTGGKQYQIAAGDTLRVEKLQGEVGETVELSDVLLVADGDDVKVGQ
ncbi:MAG: 50S ribosomal protein L21, partial [Deltaproteobacteria bacterium]|nr:50S ribosomal protein L21 [Deltaproteobacteria bacterium]